jgi:hypothetical protein
MVARRIVLAVLVLIGMTSCAPASQQPRVLVLLTSFEGRYREVGNDVLYPVQLALADAGEDTIQLRAVDVGANLQEAVARAAALAQDRTVLAVLAAGPLAAQPPVFDALGDIPVVVIGHWNANPNSRVFVMASAELPGLLTSNAIDVEAATANAADVVGGDLYALRSFANLRYDLSGVTVLSSAMPASADYTRRLLESALFVPKPGLHSTLAYDAGGMLAQVLSATAPARDAVTAALSEATFAGLHGSVHFGADGYLTDAPIIRYRYDLDARTLSVW